MTAPEHFGRMSEGSRRGLPYNRHYALNIIAHRFAHSLLVAAALVGCATTRTTTLANGVTVVNGGPTPLDPHGDVLRMLPPTATGWARFDMARARASTHWPALTAVLTNEGVTQQLERFEAETGMNPIDSDRLAIGVYQSANSPSDSWTVIVAQGGQLESTIRAKWSRHNITMRQERVGSLVMHRFGEETALAFLAPDVVAVFSAAMAPRLARQLAGEEATNASENPIYAPLWQQAGVPPTGLLVAAGDATPFANLTAGLEHPTPPIQQFVLRAELTADQQLTVRVVGRARDAESAQRTTAELERVRREYGDRFVVRLMGFGRLLNQGITVVSEGPYIRLSADTTNDEIGRIIRAISTAEAFR